MAENKMKEMLKKAFDLNDIKEETYIEGFMAGKATRYIIPEPHLNKTKADFPFMENVLKAGLIAKDKKTGGFYTTDKVLAIRASDPKKGKKKFFSINGDDPHERTTLYDAIVTIGNLRYIADKFNIPTKDIMFSIRYQNGNSSSIINYVELDKKLFGGSEEEIEENINKLNKVVKYSRGQLNEDANV